MSSIVSTDLILYGSANLPTDDVSTTGGAIDATMRPVFTQFSAPAVLSLTSSASDTRTVNITGRVAGGAYTTEAVTMNGTSEVLSANTYERLLTVKATTTNSNTITLKQGSAGTTIATISANEAGIYQLFINSASTTSPVNRYEKMFWKNSNGTNTLTSATVTLTADSGSVLLIGLASSAGDSATVANRLSAPGGVSFVSTNVACTVPTGQLASGASIGTWISEQLTANLAPAKWTFSTKLSGSTT